MALASVTLLTPWGALLALAALLPLAAALYGNRRTEAVRRELRLRPAARRRGLDTAAACLAAALLGVAATQPALARGRHPRVRADAQALFVLDTSRSMAASRSPGAPTRLARAAAAAAQLRAAIPEVASGVATITDRVLPDLLPVADASGFDGVLERAVGIEEPPPRDVSVRATTFGALGAIPASGYFAPSATRRLVILLTDGESSPFDAVEVARAFSGGPRVSLVAVRFWNADESIYNSAGRADAAYRPDPSGRATLAQLAAATGGYSFEEDALGSAAATLRRLAGQGPTVAASGLVPARTVLAPYLGAAALALLGLALAPRLGLGWRRPDRGKYG